MIRSVYFVLLFVTDIFCLYLFLCAGLITDHGEPQNLFALTVNSPPSSRMGGSCSARLEGEQFSVSWHLKQGHVRPSLYLGG